MNNQYLWRRVTLERPAFKGGAQRSETLPKNGSWTVLDYMHCGTQLGNCKLDHTQEEHSNMNSSQPPRFG